jgi:hypothetical protein
VPASMLVSQATCLVHGLCKHTLSLRFEHRYFLSGQGVARLGSISLGCANNERLSSTYNGWLRTYRQRRLTSMWEVREGTKRGDV